MPFMPLILSFCAFFSLFLVSDQKSPERATLRSFISSGTDPADIITMQKLEVAAALASSTPSSSSPRPASSRVGKRVSLSDYILADSQDNTSNRCIGCHAVIYLVIATFALFDFKELAYRAQVGRGLGHTQREREVHIGL